MTSVLIPKARIRAFRAKIYRHFRLNGRRLPWRRTRDPYRILISEVMLQQTQVERVKSFYAAFLKRFPTVLSLSRAPLVDVLSVWQGLGYNRRAKFLRDAARTIVARHGGRVPRDLAALRALPGVGPYTAGAVRAFAWNEVTPVIETNIRNVFTYEFFPHRRKVSDAELTPLVEATLDRKNPRRWYAALMDYGAALKKRERGLNAKNAHYVKQEPFKNSLREVRGNILAVLTRERRALTERVIAHFSHARIGKVREAVQSLAKDGLITVSRGRVSLL